MVSPGLHRSDIKIRVNDLAMLTFISANCPGDFSEEDLSKLINTVRNWVGVLVTSFEFSTYSSLLLSCTSKMNT